jgi:hypothetical protein
MTPLMHIIKGTLRKSAQKMGYDIVRFNAPRRSPAAKKPEFPVDFDEETQDIIRHVRYYTRTSPERIFSERFQKISLMRNRF